MSKEILVPDIGTDAVDVTEILVAVGEKVTQEQTLVSVEGDKASMEIPSPQEGTVEAIHIKVGDKIETGALMMTFAQDKALTTQAAPEKTPTPTGSATREVCVPDIGDDEVEVTEVSVSVGDRIQSEQTILSVEGDKASMEIPAPFAGVVKSIAVQVGSKVRTGSVVMAFESAESNPNTPADTKAPSEQVLEQEQPVLVPDIGADPVNVTEILVAVGDEIKEEQSLLTVEGDKASMEIPAPFAGIVKSIETSVGSQVQTGTLMMVFTTQASSPAPPSTPSPAVSQEQAPIQPTKRPASDNTTSFVANSAYAHASPLIRRLAREFGIDLAKVKGSGRKNRITKSDVQAYVKGIVQQVESGSGGGSGMGVLPWPKVDFAKFGEIETVPLSRIQKISGPNLHRNWAMIPHVTQFDEADITDLEAFRKAENQIVEKRKLGFKITPLVFILKACAATLATHPKFCASLSEDGESLVMKKYIHIGVAVDTPNGLVVPVVRNVDKKGIYELSKELAEISQKAREGKLMGGDMQGGCFTISSLGGIGGTNFTPIVNAPEVAILGVARSSMKPHWNGKEFVPRLTLPLALSYDHRVIDGADGARFSQTLTQMLSDLRRLAL